jgi:hypothetical protein
LRFSHKIPPTEVPFIPSGAIIHSTRTRTMWDALRVIGSEAYGTHFVIASHKKYPNPEFELLSSVPSTIFMPMGWESAVPHSAFLSTITWGIDLRNVGKLRPWRSPIGADPTPIFNGEETIDMFRYTKSQQPSFFWWDNLWRSKFNGHAEKWFNFYYEVPSFAQIKTLIILLRVLNALYPMTPSMVIPASCIRNIDPVTPHVPWDLVRKFVFDTPEERPTLAEFNHIIQTAKTRDDFDYTASDAIFTTDTAKMQMWRSESDEGLLHFVINGDNINFVGKHHGTKAQYIQNLMALGYSLSDVSFNARLYAAGHNIHPDNFTDSINSIHKKILKLQG